MIPFVVGGLAATYLLLAAADAQTTTKAMRKKRRKRPYVAPENESDRRAREAEILQADQVGSGPHWLLPN
jgi:hypothetical protein